MAVSPVRGLRQLARLYGVQLEYRDVQGKQQRASSETLFRVLQAFTPSFERPANVDRALTEKRLADAKTFVEPVTIAWTDERPMVQIRLPQSEVRHLQLHLEFEGQYEWTRCEELPTLPRWKFRAFAT